MHEKPGVVELAGVTGLTEVVEFSSFLFVGSFNNCLVFFCFPCGASCK